MIGATNAAYVAALDDVAHSSKSLQHVWQGIIPTRHIGIIVNYFLINKVPLNALIDLAIHFRILNAPDRQSCHNSISSS